VLVISRLPCGMNFSIVPLFQPQCSPCLLVNVLNHLFFCFTIAKKKEEETVHCGFTVIEFDKLVH
jgi:hypothetical protein